MLKINLLPTTRREAAAPADASRVFVIVLAGTLVVFVSVLFLFHSSKLKDVQAARDQNRNAENQVNAIHARVADHDHIRDQLAQIHAREEAIGRLEGARTGPTSMLVELSHLLSPGGRPFSNPAVLERVQRDNPTQMFNDTWDPHRLWLGKFAEDHRDVQIEGQGRTADDVGEFMRRMMLSQYFEEVRLERSEGATDDLTKIAVQRFKIAARVRY